MSAAPDRAAIAAASITLIVASALRKWHATGDLATLAKVRAEITATLRDEFHDIARMTRDEIRLNDD
jgi:hypothetical protein